MYLYFSPITVRNEIKSRVFSAKLKPDILKLLWLKWFTKTREFFTILRNEKKCSIQFLSKFIFGGNYFCSVNSLMHQKNKICENENMTRDHTYSLDILCKTYNFVHYDYIIIEMYVLLYNKSTIYSVDKLFHACLFTILKDLISTKNAIRIITIQLPLTIIYPGHIPHSPYFLILQS